MLFVPRATTSSNAATAKTPAPSATTIHCAITAQVRSRDTAFQLDAHFSAASRRVALFGPSGSGKSLTLMALAGLLTPQGGRIAVRGRTFFDAQDGIDVPARKRRVGFVFQDYALFPHLSVRDNVAFGLKPVFGYPRPAHRARIDELLELCGLKDLAARKPHQISGGQRQRTALARALAPNPDLLLLDEPFTALDQPLRQRMRAELSTILNRFDTPMVLVSHDLDDIDHFAQTLVAFGHGQVLDVIDYATRRQTESARAILDPLYLAAQDATDPSRPVTP
ncbi:MAG: ATP-binding cassette domain-containing protein [Deltaproteobacteria bacterium]|nr:ATP-binding cassette domain-containing protein [Deltaproteobacteria bacterium]